jgi:hypothetical protein
MARWTPWPPAGPRQNNPQGEIAAIDGVRALGLLETREAALALVDLLGKGLPVSISQYIEYGIRRSPYPKEILAAMEKQIDMPDIPITTQWFSVFSDLEATVASNPPDYARAYAGSLEKVVAGIKKKRGDARDISLRTIEQLR